MTAPGRPRNPWPRQPLDDDGRHWAWWMRDEVQRCHSYIRSLVRIRWAARQSCARLRAERDAARRELRALEWIFSEIGGDEINHAAARRVRSAYSSWAEAALALGWEGP